MCSAMAHPLLDMHRLRAVLQVSADADGAQALNNDAAISRLTTIVDTPEEPVDDDHDDE